MGLPKQYRKELKYRVASARYKTLKAPLSTKFSQELGMSETESRLLGDRIGKWILFRKDTRGPNQIIFEASKSNASFAKRYSSTKKIKLIAYDVEDLDIELESGLYASQTARE